ncbi:RNA polymerase sigma-70 factor [Mucilaginibacter gotjawali]|uniref:RNA polymerase sigma-70 factor (ECF subfamily) n=1 Tax=Mucilaginibacter gotjawali TaxID=1550579 RepID=A0A839SAX4_9SPHI|nr:RNA polymerase sigma-70 factor [Mucilaginibacter gotjawali]MBB3054738.1 RNA polymerase sigma-70 factor (ECF subfamily) [Mucilaginibacter gotjawali]
MPNNALTDKQLWMEIVNDDFRAFNVFFKRYWKKLYLIAFKILKDKDACEEIIEDIFIYLWNERMELDIKSFPQYLSSATRYKVYNYLRSAKASPLVYEEDAEEKIDAFCLNLGEEHIRQDELYQQLSQYLDLLPKRCKEIFIMSRLEQLSNEEIADRLLISKRTVENQVTVALKHLRLSLKDSVLIFLLVDIISHG